MKKTKLYLDTSVMSHLEAPDVPEKMADTCKLWDLLKTGEAEVFLSIVGFNEIDRCDEPKRSQMYGYLTQIQYTHLTDDLAVDALASKLISFGILKEVSRGLQRFAHLYAIYDY